MPWIRLVIAYCISVLLAVAAGCTDYLVYHESDGGDASDRDAYDGYVSDGDAGDDAVIYYEYGDCCGEVESPDIEMLNPSCTGSPCTYVLEFELTIHGGTVRNTVQFKNVGVDELRIYDLPFEMGTPEDFFLDESTLSRLPIVLAPGAESEFEVIYQSWSEFDQFGVLNIISNDPDEALVRVQLVGTL
jgi:hypothetical protein